MTFDDLKAIADALEGPAVLLERDEDGDILAYDLKRPGLVIHGKDVREAIERLVELQPQYDALTRK